MAKHVTLAASPPLQPLYFGLTGMNGVLRWPAVLLYVVFTALLLRDWKDAMHTRR